MLSPSVRIISPDTPLSPSTNTLILPSTLHTQPHAPAIQRALSELSLLFADDPITSSSTLWNMAGERGGVRWYTRPSPSQGEVVMPIVRADGVVDGGWSVEEVDAVLHSHGARRVWDERFVSGDIVRTYQPGMSWLAHVTLKGTFPVTHRDMAVVVYKHRCLEEEKEGYLYHVLTSVEDDLVPPSTGCVRAHLHVSGWIIRPCEVVPGRLLLTYIVRLDVRGALPHTLVHALIQNLAGCVGTVGRYLTRFGYPTHMHVPPPLPVQPGVPVSAMARSRMYGSVGSVVRVLAESFEHRGAVYDLVFRVESRAPPPILPTGKNLLIPGKEQNSSSSAEEDHSVWDVEVRCCKRMYPEGVEVEVRTRGMATWWVVEEEGGTAAERVIATPDQVGGEDTNSASPVTPNTLGHRKSSSEPTNDDSNVGVDEDGIHGEDEVLTEAADRERRERRKKHRVSSAAVISPLMPSRELMLIPPPTLPDSIIRGAGSRISWHPSFEAFEEYEGEEALEEEETKVVEVRPVRARPQRAHSRTLRPHEEIVLPKMTPESLSVNDFSATSGEKSASAKEEGFTVDEKKEPFVRESMGWLVRIRMMSAAAGAHAVQVCVRRKEDDTRRQARSSTGYEGVGDATWRARAG